MLDVEFVQFTDTGKVRDHNEDYLGFAAPAADHDARHKSWLFVLADGVGGQDRGEVASRAAVEHLLSGFRRLTAGDSLNSVLPRLVQAANTHVFETAAAVVPGGSSMATTIVACALRFDRATVSHAGDSRCYLIRHGQARQITRDHTVVAEQVRLGILSAREAEEAQTRHLLSRSLGNDLFVNVEIGDHQVHAGDVLLLCSDGLHDLVTDEKMLELARDGELSVATEQLVRTANENGGYDNISVILLEAVDAATLRARPGPTREYRLP